MNNQCCELLFVAISNLKKEVFLRKCLSLKNPFMEAICPTWLKEHYGPPSCLFRRICAMVTSKIKKKESQKSILNCIGLFPALVAKQY